jgi:predicted DNA-binding WGR domain protein
MSEMKVCPYCGNEILAVAKKCKFCKQWLPEETVVNDNNSNDATQTNGSIQNTSIDTGNIKDDPYYDLIVEMNKEIQNKKAKKGFAIALCVVALVAVVGLVTMLVTKDSGTKNTIVSVQVGNQWGYIEKKTGAYVIKPQFDDAYSFAKNGLARVSQKGKWGYIDKTGQFVIKPQYDIAVDFTDYGLARVVIDNKLGCIDPIGKYVINPQPVLFFDFAKNGLAEAKLNDKWGYVDKTGKYVIEPQFDYAYGFADNGFALVKQKDKWGYIDNTGGFVIKPQFDVAHVFADNGFAIVKQNEKWGYIDKIGKFVITPQFDEAYGFADNGLAIVKQNDKWGYIDKTGKIVITPQFDKAYGFADNGLAIVKQNDKWGYIDKTGKNVITPQFDEAYGFADNGLARVEQKGKWGYIDKTGKYVINPQFDYALGFTDDGLAIVKQDHKYGIIDKTGKYVVKPQFDDIGHFKVKSNTDVAIDLANMWDSFHNLKNVDGFASIYAPQVKYYQQTYTLKQIIKSKQDLFSKTPGFQQSVSNFKVTNNTDGSVIVYFDKRVWTSTKENPKTYPSYLVVKKINGNWLIIEESDEVTDANLAKKKEAVSAGEELVYSVADDGYVNVRQFPDSESDEVGVLATNRDGAKLISNQGAWWKVRIDSVVGYVSNEYVKLSNTPIKISGLPKVYYVVLGSYGSLDSALTYNYQRPDGMECWIYKCTANGKAVYRLCDGCFSTLQKAQSAINDWSSGLYGHLFADAWIWKNDGLGNCVFCPVNYETERTKPPLTPE